MKRSLFVVASICLLMFTNNVSAKELYYTNSNGVEFSYEEYDFLTRMFWDGCQDLMNQDQYNAFIDSNYMYGEFDSETVTIPGIMPRGTSVTINGRTLKISKSCSGDCLIGVSHTWSGTPPIKGYDVIGAYLEDTSLIGVPSVTIETSSNISYDKDIQYFSNGFGASFLIPSGNSPIIGLAFRVKTGGHVYASYQHAKESISLADSKKYTLSKAGYGGVFKFTGPGLSVYDKFSGVDIAV